MAIQIDFKTKIKGLERATEYVLMKAREKMRDAGEYAKFKIMEFIKRWHSRWSAYVPPLRSTISRTVWLPVGPRKKIPVYPSRAPLYETSSRRLMEAVENPEVQVSHFGDKFRIKWDMPHYYKFLHGGAKLWGWDKGRGRYKKYWLPARPLLPDENLVPRAGSKKYHMWYSLIDRFIRASRRFWERLREDLRKVVNR